MLMVHGTCVELDGRGLLFRGPSGSGKSDLALRLIDAGAKLVADDQVELRRDGDRLMARPPALLAGKLEVRGLGILAFPHAADVPLAGIVDLVAPGNVERMPEPRHVRLLDTGLPAASLFPFEASAVAKVRAFTRLIATGGHHQARPPA